MNYADIKTVDIQDGEGIRVSIYVSGCHFRCKGCHNKEAWDFEFGKKFDETTIDYILELLNHDYIAGLSLLGGEPLEKVNQQGLVPLVKAVKEKYPNKNIWCYTGYDFEKDILGKMYEENDYTRELINNIDIMVDGEFIEEKKLTDLKFRGSTNQRKIDVKASLKEKKVVTLKFGDEARYEVKEPKIVLFEEYVTKNENIEEEAIPVTAGAIYSINNDKKVETEIQKETVKISAKQKSNFPNENLD